jgi:hypothetical protein
MTNERGDLRILLKLVRQPGWFSELPDNIRKSVVGKLVAVLNKPDARSREIIGVSKVLCALERADIERAKLSLSMEVEEDEEEDPTTP